MEVYPYTLIYKKFLSFIHTVTVMHTKHCLTKKAFLFKDFYILFTYKHNFGYIIMDLYTICGENIKIFFSFLFACIAKLILTHLYNHSNNFINQKGQSLLSLVYTFDIMVPWVISVP